MSGVITVSRPEGQGPPSVGDIFKAQIFFDEKVGSSGDAWEIVSANNEAWLPAGTVTASVASLRVVPSDEGTTKLEFDAMVHQPGPLVIGPLTIRNQVSKTEFDLPAQEINGAETTAGTKPPEEPPWYLPDMPYGGWDWPLISALLAVILVGAAFLGHMAWRRLRAHLTRNLTYTERALNALANLQKYARTKSALNLDEWKKFSFELAGILRKFSDENFKMDSRDMTDREFLHELRIHEAATPYLSLIGGILATITEVRYGRKELDSSVVPGLLLDARRFVESTSTEPKDEDSAK